MKTEFRRSFEKDLTRIKDPKLLRRISEVIEEVENSKNLNEVRNIKKLNDYSSYYRIRVGNYRIGLELIDDSIWFIRALHRKEIYRYFP
jgi:mRNA interferase RelE/StbE